MLSIREALKTDNFNDIIKLIYETDNYIYPSMCDGNYELFEKIMQNLIIEDNLFSYKNMIIACEDDKVVGLLLYLNNKAKLPGKQHDSFDLVISDYFSDLIKKIDGNHIYINNLCVDKDYRGIGIGTKLVNYLFRMLDSKNIFFDCLEDNIVAVNFYKKIGFDVTDRCPGFAGNETEQVSCLKFEWKK